jgi:mannose/fructose-specific phosphotransferase system component IIA
MSRVPALLVMHADLASAMIRAAEKLDGPVEEVEILSNEGLSRDTLEEEIEKRVGHWDHGGIVLTDFWGGSCHICGASAARRRAAAGTPGHGEVIIVTGINLPALIDYLHNRDQYDVVELAERVRRKGQESFRIQRGEAA